MEEADGHHPACGTRWPWVLAWAPLEGWEAEDGSPPTLEKLKSVAGREFPST